MLGQNCSEEDGQIVAAILEVESTSFDDKYLGLPIPEGRMKMASFSQKKKDCERNARIGMRNTCMGRRKKL
jgi:hypothetical protein